MTSRKGKEKGKAAWVSGQQTQERAEVTSRAAPGRWAPREEEGVGWGARRMRGEDRNVAKVPARGAGSNGKSARAAPQPA